MLSKLSPEHQCNNAFLSTLNIISNPLWWIVVFNPIRFITNLVVSIDHKSLWDYHLVFVEIFPRILIIFILLLRSLGHNELNASRMNWYFLAVKINFICWTDFTGKASHYEGWIFPKYPGGRSHPANGFIFLQCSIKMLKTWL